MEQEEWEVSFIGEDKAKHVSAILPFRQARDHAEKLRANYPNISNVTVKRTNLLKAELTELQSIALNRGLPLAAAHIGKIIGRL